MTLLWYYSISKSLEKPPQSGIENLLQDVRNFHFCIAVTNFLIAIFYFCEFPGLMEMANVVAALCLLDIGAISVSFLA